MKISIREFEHEDYQAVYQLWQRAGLGMRTSDALDELEKVRSRDRDLFLVALCGGNIVGAVLGAFDGRRGWVYHLAVEPSLQKRGIGRELMEELLTRYRAKGVNKVNLMVTADNEVACEFYEKMGFIKHNYIVMGIPLEGKY